VDRAADAGLKFFADLNKAGNFVPVIGKVASLAQGATPIVIRWDYNALADRDTLKGNPKVDVVVPKSGVVAGVYVRRRPFHPPELSRPVSADHHELVSHQRQGQRGVSFPVQ